MIKHSQLFLRILSKLKLNSLGKIGTCHAARCKSTTVSKSQLSSYIVYLKGNLSSVICEAYKNEIDHHLYYHHSFYSVIFSQDDLNKLEIWSTNWLLNLNV